MKKLLIWGAMLLPLAAATSCGNNKSEEKVEIDSLSYLEGRISGLDFNLGWARSLKETPDSLRPMFVKEEFAKGYAKAMEVDTTSQSFLMGLYNSAQYLGGYNQAPWSKSAPLDYKLFKEEFAKAFMADHVDTVKLTRMSADYRNMLERMDKATAEEAREMLPSYITLSAQGFGMSLGYQFEMAAADPNAPGWSKEEFVKGVDYYISLMPKTPGYEVGFSTGLTDLMNIIEGRAMGVKIVVKDYKDAFIEAFKAVSVSEATFNDTRRQLTEMITRTMPAQAPYNAPVVNEEGEVSDVNQD